MLTSKRCIALALGLAGAVSAAMLIARVQASADGQLSVLPAVGASQVYSASLGEPYQNSATGTVTIARSASDSAHVTVADGLPPFDQTLSVTSQGSLVQPSPSNQFVDLLDTVATILAAAPSTAQKDTQWTVNLPSLGWMESGSGLSAQQAKAVGSVPPVPLTTKVVSASGDALTLHGEGTMKQEAMSSMGLMGSEITIVIDIEVKSGHLDSCSRTATESIITEGNARKIGQTISLTAK